MAESILFGIAQNVLWKLGSLALDEVLLAWGVKSDLRKLHNTLSSIQAVLLDAEEQQANNHQLEDWLGKLKDVIYEIDEVVDEFDIKALQQKVCQGSTIGKVRQLFSHSNQLVFNFNMGHKIKGIRERLDEIDVDKNQFKLLHRPVDRHIIHSERETHSFLHASDVIGRDEDKNKIVKLLMSSVDHETLSVIPILGIGGLGKTTLAKMVYNDERVVKNFELRMWACVSEESELRKLIEKVIKATKTGEDCKNLDLEQLQSLLRDTLNTKKYLLILDDVWNLEPTKWRELKNLLGCGSCESKIVVTTRNNTIASFMGSTEPHILKGLSHEECLSLFEKWAFKEGQETQSQRKLMEIGEEIVRKCKGIPLAVRTLGSMLHMNINEREWMSIRDNEMWKLEQKEGGILPALRLSYDQLPSYLKRCFAYCSIYPKDLEISSIQMINVWMAQGLIQSPNQNKEEELEDVGFKYIRELLSISFFQDFVDYGYFITFKMHDLVHDLALFVAKSEHATIDTNINHDDEPNKMKNKSISRKVQHISFGDSTSDSSPSEVPTSLLELNNLRSIYFQYVGVGPTSKSFVETCTSRFKCLRLLTLSHSSFETIPSSIGRLKHLRYLSLEDNRSIKSLPNSICKFVCLQTLLLEGCEKLEKLPSDFGKLISLRYLGLTTQERCLSAKRIFASSNNCMTSALRTLRISKCSNLESLFDDYDDVVVENGMRHTSALRTLLITECASLFALPRGLRYLSALENLIIEDCENLDLNVDTQIGEEDIVRTGGGGGGGGLRSLQFLTFYKLPKLVALPQWILQGSACNALKEIVISNCPNFTTLMPDWMTEDLLKSLQKLWIGKCPQLTSLPNGMQSLTTLEEIEIWECPELIRRCERETGEDWNKIAHVPHIYLDGFQI